MDFNFPEPSQEMYMQNAYTSDGKSIKVETYPASQKPSGSLGASFSSLIGTNVSVPANPLGQVVTEKKDLPITVKKKKKKDSSTSTEVSTDVDDQIVDSKNVVESTIYADTYMETNRLTYGVIAQTDELLRESKEDLDFIRSQRNMKGKYHYTNAVMASMSSLLTTKLAAIKEINSNIKNANDAEYRRFKDFRAAESTDDNKAIMNAYSAFISAPVGSPMYNAPDTLNMTAGLNGVVPAQLPPEVQSGMDAGLMNYLTNLSPEEKIMLNDNNSDIEEYIVYDQSSGARKFAWFDNRTGQEVNLPASSSLTLEDYTIDTNTKLARNLNVNDIKKVKIVNGDQLSRF